MPSARSSPPGWSGARSRSVCRPRWTFLLIPVGAGAVALLGAVIEPLLLRPFYRRAEEYQLLVTFGLLLILEDVIRFFWGGLPLSADPIMDALPIIRIGGLIYPGYNLVVIGDRRRCRRRCCGR